jgi:hypothetical protein
MTEAASMMMTPQPQRNNILHKSVNLSPSHGAKHTIGGINFARAVQAGDISTGAMSPMTMRVSRNTNY